jgi:uncharacterized iron-regulated membrane protein
MQIISRTLLSFKAVSLAALSVATLTMSDAALAQFKWKDSNGRWVYSDQPPPSGVSAQPMTAPSAKASAPQVASTEAQPKHSADDKALAAKRKEIEAAQSAKEKQDLVKKNQVACDETRANLQAMQSGVRVVTRDAEGERRFLSDQEKQTRGAAAQKDLSTHCNG